MNYKEIEYNECPEVYEPESDTFLLIDNLILNEGETVLEIGAGTGIVSIAASFKASKVTSTDINPYAIKCIKSNIELNNRKNITVLTSDLFENIHEQYDLILFNTPYLPVPEEEHVDDYYSKAWDGGVDGRVVIDRFLEEVADYVKDNGRVQLIQSSLSNNDKTLDYLEKKGFESEITAIKHEFFEDVVLISGFKKS